MEHTREKTVADPLVTERLIAAALDADRYLDGTHFLPSDAADLAPMLARALETRSPVAVIYRDGRELLATPVLGRLGGLAAAIKKRLPARASVTTGAATPVIFPPFYRVELRESQPRSLSNS